MIVDRLEKNLKWYMQLKHVTVFHPFAILKRGCQLPRLTYIYEQGIFNFRVSIIYKLEKKNSWLENTCKCYIAANDFLDKVTFMLSSVRF